MNGPQRLWWRQAASDHEAFVLLRKFGAPQCQILHYLQMATEKIAKAYFWRNNKPPPRSHAGFVQFLRFLGQVRQRDRDRIARILSFNRFSDLQHWIRTVLPIAYSLEALSPDLAGDGPNPEYPWPHFQPIHAPAEYSFQVWNELMTRQGRDLMRITALLIARFPEYADT